MCIEIPTRRADLYKRIDWISAAQSALYIYTLIGDIEDRIRSVSGAPRCNLHVSPAISLSSLFSSRSFVGALTHVHIRDFYVIRTAAGFSTIHHALLNRYKRQIIIIFLTNSLVSDNNNDDSNNMY